MVQLITNLMLDINNLHNYNQLGQGVSKSFVLGEGCNIVFILGDTEIPSKCYAAVEGPKQQKMFANTEG